MDELQLAIQGFAWAALRNLLWACICFGLGFLHATFMGLRRGDRTLTEFWTWAAGVAVGIYLFGMIVFTVGRVLFGSLATGTVTGG